MDVGRSASLPYRLPRNIWICVLGTCLLAALVVPSGAMPPAPVELSAVARRVPPTIEILRLETTRYQAVLVGETADWNHVAELIENLASLPELDESELLEMVAEGERYRFILAIPYAGLRPKSSRVEAEEKEELLRDKVLDLLTPGPVEPGIKNRREVLAPPEVDDPSLLPEHPLAEFQISEIQVLEILRTSAGDLARVRARSREFLAFAGDILSDGKIQAIDFGSGNRKESPGLRFERRSGPAPPAQPTQPTPRDSALLELDCAQLASSEALLLEVLTEAQKRIRVYQYELHLAESRFSRVDRGSVARFRRSVAQAAADELVFLFHSQLPKLNELKTLPSSPAEIFSLLGDLELMAGRHLRAAAAYRLAEERSPEYRPLCGRLFEGKLYGVESRSSWNEDPHRVPMSYLLTWDPPSGRVLERRFLTSLPNAFVAEPNSLRITFPYAPEVRTPFSAVGQPTPFRYPDLRLRFRTLRHNFSPVLNFISPESLNRFEVGYPLNPRFPWNPPDLEARLRAEASRDPTQPWYAFWLGQLYSTLGRGAEAEKIWQEIFPDLGNRLPSSDLVWMAAYHEYFGRPAWGDRIYEVAAAQNQKKPRSLRLRHWLQRPVGGCPPFFDLWLRRQPERHYLWWQRLHELSGPDRGDSLRSLFWSEERARRGDPIGARVERARAETFLPGDPVVQSVWLDYALYWILALFACIYVRWTLLTLEIPFGIRPRPQPARVGARAWLHGAGPELLLLYLALFLVLTLALLAVAYQGLAETRWISDDAQTEPQPGQILRALLAGGVFENSPPMNLVTRLHRFDARRWLVLGLLATFVFGFAATPAAFVLSLERTRNFVARFLPGARYFRQGANWRGLLVFGLFAFALFPLLRLGLVAAGIGLPTPGPISEQYLQSFESTYLPPGRLPLASRDSDDGFFFPTGSLDWTHPEDLKNMCRRSFFSLLTIYPGAKVFWTLVFVSLAVSLWAHFAPRRP